MGLASLQIQNSNNVDVLLDSGLKLPNIIVNLCSKLSYEVLLKSGKLYCESIEFDTYVWDLNSKIWLSSLSV